MRFSDEEYLRAWKQDGVWPKIHDSMFTLFSSTFESKSVCDICCCTGLLGQHIKDTHGIKVCAIEGDKAWVERGKLWGTNVPTLNEWILPETLPTVLMWLKDHEVTGLVARRCISELFGSDIKGKHLKAPNYVWAERLTAALVAAGIREIWLEGRANQGRSVHPIPSTDAEAKCFESGFKISDRYRDAAYLTAQ